MKTVIMMIIFTLIASTAYANPVEEATCQSGGEFGNDVVIKLSRDFTYGQLTIKRTNTGKDYSRDLSTFKGGAYRLDLASQGGITGFSVTYKKADEVDYKTYEANLDCSVATSVPVPTTTPVVSAPTPTPTPTPENIEPDINLSQKEETVETSVPQQAEMVVEEDVVDEDSVDLEESEKDEFNF